jgi:hypothetical protein
LPDAESQTPEAEWWIGVSRAGSREGSPKE